MKSTKMVSFLVLALALTLASSTRIHKKKSDSHLQSSSCWTQLSGAANDIGVGADGSVWVIGTNSVAGGYGIYKYNSGSNGWNSIAGGAVRISVDPSGLPWVVNNQGTVYQGTATGGWNAFASPTCAKDIGVGPDGTVWVIGCNSVAGGYGIYKYTGGNNWASIAGGAVRIAVDPFGYPWVVNNQGTVYQGTPTGGWNAFASPTCASDIGIGADGTVAVIGCNSVSGGYGIYKYNPNQNNDWVNLTGGAVDIAVAPGGLPWVVNSNNYIYESTCYWGK